MGEDIKTIGTGTRSERRSERMDAARQQRADALLSSRQFKSAITRASRQTDENFHGEARKTIAKAFGYNDLADRYGQVNKEHHRVGYLTPELHNKRNDLDTEMERRIRKDYGEKGLSAYRKGL